MTKDDVRLVRDYIAAGYESPEDRSATQAAGQAFERIAASLVPPPPATQPEDLVDSLRAEKHDAYAERNKLVAALSKLFPSGLAETAIPGWDPEWRWCVFVTLPTGQASWHIRESERPMFAHLPVSRGNLWDGHTTEEKYRRLAGLSSVPATPPQPQQDDQLDEERIQGHSSLLILYRAALRQMGLDNAEKEILIVKKYIADLEDRLAGSGPSPAAPPDMGWMVGEPLSQAQFDWVKAVRGPAAPPPEAQK